MKAPSEPSPHLDERLLVAFARGRIFDMPSDQSDIDWQRAEQHLKRCTQCQHRVACVAPDAFMQKLASCQLTVSGDGGGAAASHTDYTDNGSDSNRLGPWRLVAGYEVFEELGRGGMGVVYRARLPGLARDVALKRLITGVAASPEQLRRFRREAEVLGRLQHPNLVTVFDVGEQAGEPYCAMELIDGPSLASWLRTNGPMEAREAAGLLAALADAIQSAHRSGVVHRDLKPANVLLTQSATLAQSATRTGRSPIDLSQPKIVDFGLARLVSDAEGQTVTGAALGTPNYMAPEQVAGDTESMSAAIDVYGLGAILYECLVGRPPFVGSSPLETIDMVRTAEVVPVRRLRSGVPIDLQTICHKCLEKQPLRRYGSAGAVRDDLQRILDGRPIVARPPSRVRKMQLWIARHPWPSLAAAVVLLAVLLGLFSAAWHQQQLARQRDAAHRHFAQARATIWEMLHVADSQSVMEIPRLAEMSLAQAREALQLFELLAAEEATADAEADLARVRNETARLLIATGESEAAIELLKVTSGSLLRMVEASPDHRGLLDALYECHNMLGSALYSRGQWDRSLAIFDATIGRIAPLYQRTPDDMQTVGQLARLYHGRGTALLTGGQYEAAIESLAEAIRLRSVQRELDVGDADVVKHIAGSQINMAECYKFAGRIDESIEQYETALESLGEVLRHRPDNTTALISLAIGYLNLSNVRATVGDMAGAVECCSAAIDLIEPLHEIGGVTAARDNLSRLYANRANYATDATEKSRDYRRAAELALDPAIRDYCRTTLVRSLVAAEALDEAITEAQAIDASQLDGINRFRLAAAWGLIAEHLHRRTVSTSDSSSQSNPDGDDPQARAVHAVSQSLTLIEQLHSEGHFGNHADAAQYFNESSDFSHVRPLASATLRKAAGNGKHW